jgi:hypothetical protein
MSKEQEFVPLIGLSVGSKKGPLAKWLDELAQAQPKQDKSEVQTEALRRLLILWAIIIRYWILNEIVIEPHELSDLVPKVCSVYCHRFYHPCFEIGETVRTDYSFAYRIHGSDHGVLSLNMCDL